LRSISYKRHRFPAEVIRHAVWLYFRFTLSLRDVEELLAQRGVEVSYETIRCWTLKFGRQFAHNLRRSRPRPTGRWHLPIRRRDRKQQKFKSRASAQRFLATHAAVYNVFNLQPVLSVQGQLVSTRRAEGAVSPRLTRLH
jgi:transposase-like protein